MFDIQYNRKNRVTTNYIKYFKKPLTKYVSIIQMYPTFKSVPFSAT